MPRGRKWIELDPKECEADDCDNTFERRRNQTTTQFRAQKFCSPECAHANQRRPGSEKRSMCGKKLHEMTDDNVYVDGNGFRRCRSCVRIRDAKRADRQAGARSATGTTAADRRVAAAAPPTLPVPPGQRWRPAGWSAEPKTFHAGQASS